MFFYDYWYIILVLPAMIFALWASYRVNSTFDRYAKKLSVSGLTGAEAAARVLRENDVRGVDIQRVSGKLTDHFDPRNKTIFLSDSVYDSTSCAAIGVAAHEAGHAVQHAKEYAPLKIRSAIIPITNLGSKLAIPLLLIGMPVMSFAATAQTEQIGLIIAFLGIDFFALSTLFQLVTLPTEFNASRRAIEALDGSGVLQGEELAGAKKVLSAAALTYVAALAVSLAQLLRLVLLVMGGNRRR